MCNEFRFETSLQDILAAFSQLQIPLDWAGGAPNVEPRASIRPTDPAYLVTGRDDGGARLSQLRWGFPGPKGPIINFRSEGRRFPQGRCIVPVDGFFEFTGDKAPKSKWLFTSAAGGFLGVADDGALIYFEDQRTPPSPDMLGHVVVVETDTDEVLVKRLLRGSKPGLFDLESVAGPVRQDARLRWAAHITAIIPPFQARRIIRNAA